MVRDVRVPVTDVGTSSNHVCDTCSTVAMICDVKVPVADLGTSSNHACATCLIVATGEVRPLLLGHHCGDRTAMAGHLTVATEGYRTLLQRCIVLVCASLGFRVGSGA
jgi:hypothetical protein